MQVSAWSRRIRDEKGSLFLEKTLLFPTVFVGMLAFLFFSLQNYQQVYLFQLATQAAQRLSFVWDNSNRDFETGHSFTNRRDGLYWRWEEGGLGPLVFLGENRVNVAAAALPQSPSSLSLAERKLSEVWRHLPEGVSGNVTFSRQWILQHVSVELNKDFQVPGTLHPFLQSRNLLTHASSAVVEPVETIRTVDLVRSYFHAVIDALTPEQFKETLRPFQRVAFAEPRAPEFDRQQEAKVYLQRLVEGKSERMDTVDQEYWRNIDALDADGVAHQAKIFRRRSDYMNDQVVQLKKDAELLQKGQVKGVVWHFFKGRGEPSAHPDPHLRALLEQHGIVVIVHE